MTVDDWLIAMHDTSEPDPDAKFVLRVAPPLYASLMKAGAEVAMLPESYYDTAPQFGHAQVVIDFAFPPGGWALFDEVEQVAICGGVLDPIWFDPPPSAAMLGVCEGCGRRYTFGHQCPR